MTRTLAMVAGVVALTASVAGAASGYSGDGPGGDSPALIMAQGGMMGGSGMMGGQEMMSMERMQAHMARMQGMMADMERDPAQRPALMRKHMEAMSEGMAMMRGMPGGAGEGMATERRQAMMEQRMDMMMRMMEQMMGQHRMMMEE